jgi:hypothetical protein
MYVVVLVTKTGSFGMKVVQGALIGFCIDDVILNKIANFHYSAQNKAFCCFKDIIPIISHVSLFSSLANFNRATMSYKFPLLYNDYILRNSISKFETFVFLPTRYIDKNATKMPCLRTKCGKLFPIL